MYGHGSFTEIHVVDSEVLTIISTDPLCSAASDTPGHPVAQRRGRGPSGSGFQLRAARLRPGRAAGRPGLPAAALQAPRGGSAGHQAITRGEVRVWLGARSYE